MAEKTAYYFMMDWLAMQSRSENCNTRAFETYTTPPLYSIEDSNKPSWIDQIVRSNKVHTSLLSATLGDNINFDR
jgi:hypothetical protein